MLNIFATAFLVVTNMPNAEATVKTLGLPQKCRSKNKMFLKNCVKKMPYNK
jgi:hypothetical protein